MDFFGIGGFELIIIIVIALLVMGPEKIPEIARTISRTMRAVKKATDDVSQQVSKELQVEELAAAVKEDKINPESKKSTPPL